jgi:HAD superfamily hydrolase (TIGR01549 family)
MVHPIDFTTLRAVVFDLDGTLYDSRRLPLRLVCSDLAHAFMLRAERRVRKQLAGQSFADEEHLYAALFRGIAELRGCSVERVAAWYRQGYMPQMVRTLQRHYQARPDAVALLRTLQQRGLTVAVFSDYGAVAAKLEALHIPSDLPNRLFEAPALGGLKPCAQSFRAVAQQLGVSPQEILMIGDRDDTDGAGARSCGMKFLQLAKAESSAPQQCTWEQLCRMVLHAE